MFQLQTGLETMKSNSLIGDLYCPFNGPCAFKVLRLSHSGRISFGGSHKFSNGHWAPTRVVVSNLPLLCFVVLRFEFVTDVFQASHIFRALDSHEAYLRNRAFMSKDV
jgi:hypothetical protein